LKIRTRELPVRKGRNFKDFLPRHIPQNTAIYRWSSLRDSKYSLPNGRLRNGSRFGPPGDARRSDPLIRSRICEQIRTDIRKYMILLPFLGRPC
jgi:hypothetical protein